MKNLFFAICFLFCTSVFAQEIPLNPDVLYGKLDNGLTYYIHRNTNPKDRAMFYLVVNTGGIYENEDQNGLAHFCEHMAFNGTKNLPGKSLINYLESNGVAFGRGVNAGTSSAVTTYTLNNLPVTKKGFIDSALMILREWASNVSYSTEEINKERGVIHEEWRTYGGASRRMSKVTNAVLFEGSKYANHDVIGDLGVIDNSDPDLLRKFYKDWYRPDNQAIIIVGDIDRDEMKKKIEKLFSDIPKPVTKMAIEKTLIKSNKELKYTSATDKEAQGVRISVYVKHPGPEKKDLDYMKANILSSLYSMMFSDRINEMLLTENPPMISAYSSYGSLTKFQNSFTTSISALNNDPVRSFKVAMTENERVRKYGFTETELERAKSRLLVSAENAYNEREKQLSQNIVYQYVSHFNSQSPAAGAEYNYDLAKKYLPTITLEQVNSLSKKWMTEENRVIVVNGPDKEGFVIPSEADLRNALAEVQAQKIEPYIDKVVSSSLITEELKGSPVIKEEYIKEFDGTKLTLANGAKVWIKETNNKQDEISMQAFSNGGYSVLPAEDLSSAVYVSTSRSMCGIGTFSLQELRRMTAGKNASVSVTLTELEEMIMGSSSKKDFETMLQLTYLQFKPSRKDDGALNSVKQRNLEMLRNRKSDPNSVLSDTLQLVTTNYNKRTFLATPEFYNSMVPAKVYSIAEDRFRDAGDFNFLFVGNIQLASMKPLIEKYIGSIPDLPREEKWIDHKLVPAKALVQRRLSVPMKDPKAMVQLYYYGEIPCTPENVEYVNAIRYILSMRFTESIREKESGTYGVGVSGGVTSRPVNNFKFYLSFTCAPERVDYLKGILMQGLADIKEKGVTAEEVEKTKLNFLKEDAERLKNNAYIVDRVKNYINNGIYTPLPEHSTNIYNTLDGRKIQELAKLIFTKEYVDVVMVPATQVEGDL
jgi:zinc protease